MQTIQSILYRMSYLATIVTITLAMTQNVFAWEQSGGNLSYSGGRVFVGVNAPTSSHTGDANAYLQVHNPEQPNANREVARFTANLSHGTFVSYITVGDVALDKKGTQGYLAYQPSGKQWMLGTHFYPPSLSVRSMGDGGYVGIGMTDPRYPLHLKNGAYVSAGGVWTNASSREYKENIRALDTSEAISAFNELKPVVFNYKADSTEKHIGFIAEEAPDILATKDRKGMSSMDTIALLTKVVQAQQQTIRMLTERMELLEGKR